MTTSCMVRCRMRGSSLSKIHVATMTPFATLIPVQPPAFHFATAGVNVAICDFLLSPFLFPFCLFLLSPFLLMSQKLDLGMLRCCPPCLRSMVPSSCRLSSNGLPGYTTDFIKHVHTVAFRCYFPPYFGHRPVQTAAGLEAGKPTQIVRTHLASPDRSMISPTLRTLSWQVFGAESARNSPRRRSPEQAQNQVDGF